MATEKWKELGEITTEDKIRQVFQRATISKNSLLRPEHGVYFVEQKVVACPWCGHRQIAIRTRQIEFGYVYTAQCMRCRIWGPTAVNVTDATIKELVNAWNWRWKSRRSYIWRLRRWYHYAIRLRLKKEQNNGV